MACPVDPHTTITQEILLPDGYRLLACPEEYVEALRKRYVADPMVGANLVEDSEATAKVLVVAHGSHEHMSHLRRAMEAVEKLLHGIGHHKHEEPVGKRKLESNFEKFGFNASVRMFDRKSGTATPGGSSVMRLDSQVDDGDETKCQQASGIRLWKRPVVRQYFHQGLLWRAEEETTVMSFELFFDLLYVGIIAINGDHVAEEADGHELLRFVITFGMSWKIWQDVAQMISWFEVDDVLQRIEIVFLIACLLGFTTNMLHVFHEGYDTYTQLVAFYLATRLLNAAYCAVTGYLLPIVKGMMVAQVVLILIPSALWIASIHVEMPNRLALVFIALILDIFGNATIISAFRYSRKNVSKFAKRIGRFFEFYPAINIEHKVERTNAFVTLVLGYSVVVVLYQNEGWGLNAFLGKAILGLVQAFIFNWLYFEIDGANIATHAIRRHVWSATMWQNAHIPYVMGYVLGTAALGKLVLGSDCDNADPHTLTEFYRNKSEEEIHDGLRWLYCGGLGVALFSTTFINYSHVHRDLDNGRVPLLSKEMRLGNRIAVTAIILCLPLAHEHLNSLHLVSITTGLMVWVLVVDLICSMCWKTLQGKEKRSRRRMGYTARCSLKELEEAVRKAELEQSSNDSEVESQGGVQAVVKDIGETNLSKPNSTGEKAEAG